MIQKTRRAEKPKAATIVIQNAQLVPPFQNCFTRRKMQ